jgi:hypothetical protein
MDMLEIPEDLETENAEWSDSSDESTKGQVNSAQVAIKRSKAISYLAVTTKEIFSR